MINVTALCRAVDMIQNLDIQVSFRTTSETSLPYIIMAYDSRVDKFSKVRDMFPCLTPRGTTPEGLCFEAIEKNFIPSSNSMDSYFVNISDGEPYFGGQNFHYSGTPALNHTREQVKKLRMKGIQVLSYFVSNYDGEHHDFKVMYGKSARFVDVTNVAQITKTMNELFLKK
jgi:nitric oxide reductase activation protein